MPNVLSGPPADWDAYFEQLIDALKQDLRPWIDRSLATLFEETSGAVTSAPWPADAIRVLIDAVEARAKRALVESRHSRHYWFQFVRRAGPAVLQHYAHLPVQRPIFVAEGVFEACQLVLRHLPPTEPGEWYQFGQEQGGIHYGQEREDIQTLALLAFLGALRCSLANLYRLAIKGAAVNIQPGSVGISSAPTPAIMSYEARRDRFEDVLGRAGFWVDREEVRPLHLQLAQGWSVGAWRGGIIARSQDPPRSIQGRWLPIPRIEGIRGLRQPAAQAKGEPLSESPPSCPPIDTLLCRFDDAVQLALNEEATAVCAFLYALWSMVSEQLGWVAWAEPKAGSKEPIALVWPLECATSDRQKYLHHLEVTCQLGLLRGTFDGWQKGIEVHAERLALSTVNVTRLSSEEIRRLLDRFTRNDAIEDPDSPFLFVKLSSKAMVLDLLRVDDFFRQLLVVIGRVEREPAGARLGPQRATFHEEGAARYLIREFRLDPSRVLSTTDGRQRLLRIPGGVERQVDLGFVYRGTLFVIDCKAMSKDSGFMAGDLNKVRNRISTLRLELEQKCIERVELIRQGAAAGIIDATDFSQSYTLVCTTAVEYLPMDIDVFWFGKHARVGPPEELAETIRAITGA